MKNVLAIILAIVLVVIAWGLVRFLIGLVLGTVIKIGLILLFVGLVYLVFKMLTQGQKQTY